MKAFLMSMVLLVGSVWYLAVHLPREWNREPCAQSVVDGCYTEQPGEITEVGDNDGRWPVKVSVPGHNPIALRLAAEPPVAAGDPVTVRFVGDEATGLTAGTEYFDARPSRRMVPIGIAVIAGLIGLIGAVGSGVSMARSEDD